MNGKTLNISITLAITTLIAPNLASAAVIPFGVNDIFSGSGDSFVNTNATGNPLDQPVFSAQCGNPTTFADPTATFNVSFGGPVITCPEVGNSAPFPISTNPLNVTGGFAPFLSETGRFVTFGPAVNAVPGSFIEIFTADNGSETLSIEVDVSTFEFAFGAGNTVTFTYDSRSTVTDGVDTTVGTGLFSFTTQSVFLQDNLAEGPGIYDFATVPLTWSNTTLASQATPEPSAIIGLSLISMIGLWNRKKSELK